MRECIYCGRQLEKGEQCTCATSVAKRKEREARAEAERPKTKQEVKREERERKARAKEKAQREKARAREQAQRGKKQQSSQQQYGSTGQFGGFGGMGGGFGGAGSTFRRAANNSGSKNPFANIGRLLLSFLKSPVETVMNPGRMGMAEILIMIAIEGIIAGLCAFFVITGAARGIFSQIGNAMGFGGENGYMILQWWFKAAISGALGGYIVFFVYSGVFYAINRWILRQFTPYWDFVKRFVFVGLPMTVVGIVGALLGFFSLRTFIVLIICGLAGSVVLTYELLRSVWHSARPAKCMYMMLIGLFIALTILIHMIYLF